MQTSLRQGKGLNEVATNFYFIIHFHSVRRGILSLTISPVPRMCRRLGLNQFLFAEHHLSLHKTYRVFQLSGRRSSGSPVSLVPLTRLLIPSDDGELARLPTFAPTHMVILLVICQFHPSYTDNYGTLLDFPFGYLFLQPLILSLLVSLIPIHFSVSLPAWLDRNRYQVYASRVCCINCESSVKEVVDVETFACEPVGVWILSTQGQ